MGHYIVDGYNVICQSEELSAGTLQQRRERLLRFIEDRRPQGGGSHRVTVVFDGQSNVSSPRWPGPTRVMFSPGRDADRTIKNVVDESENPRDVVVVTDDRAIQRWVRGAGAEVMGAKEFLRAGIAPKRPSSSSSLQPGDIASINREVWDLWMRK